MTAHLNRIGLPTTTYYRFDDLVGGSGFAQIEQAILSRPGVDGIGLQRLGKKPKPINITTRHFVASFYEAAVLIDKYKGLCGEVPQELWRNSVPLGKYAVRSVEESPPVAVVGTVGSLIPDAQVFHVCRWQLIFIEFLPPS